MIILRNKFFSKKKKDKNKDKAIGAGMVAGGVAGYKIGKKAGEKAIDDFGSYLENSKLTAKDKEAVKEKILKKAKKQGIKIVSDPEYENSAYVGNKVGGALKKYILKTVKYLKKNGMNKEAKQLIDEVEEGVNRESGSKKMWRNTGKDNVILGKGSLADTDVLAHELGHAQYHRSGRSKSIVGKAAHTLGPVSKIADSKWGRRASFAHGVQAGMKKEKDKQEGKKTNVWNKTRSVMAPAILTAPLLTMEGKASLKGLKMMKESGASKELMKQSRKRLGAAWGTYAGGASRSIAAGGAGELSGRGIARLTKKDKDNDNT